VDRNKLQWKEQSGLVALDEVHMDGWSPQAQIFSSAQIVYEPTAIACPSVSADIGDLFGMENVNFVV
jgi:hypothetical protein